MLFAPKMFLYWIEDIRTDHLIDLKFKWTKFLNWNSYQLINKLNK